MAVAAENRTSSGPIVRTRAVPYFVALVFFVSGFPALIYQLIWQRSLFALYGINIEAVTVVVAGFLFGLGIGSLAAYLVRRSANVGQAVGVLYCVNTCGSAVACFAGAFGLMHATGMQGAVSIAAAINFVIGGAALIEVFRTRHQTGIAGAVGDAPA